MATQQLSVMVKNLRSEAGHALSIAQGTNQYETLKYLLARTQEELWVAFQWPELKLRDDMQMVAGQHTYTYSFLPFDNIRETWASAKAGAGASWCPVSYGFPSEDMLLSNGANSERGDPVQYWEPVASTAPSPGTPSYRVWPTPDTTGPLIRFVGQRSLGAFIADSDVSTLDATCIVLFAAAELLARAKAEDAATKMQKAQRHLTKLLGNKISAKMKVATLGGGSPSYRTGINRNLLWQS
jgi:hypothetical protein